jgi:probable FeS assembly SUF system protein SufT
MEREDAILSRDCDAIVIPDGIATTLKQGSQVTIMQSLGGSYTVHTDNGQMVRISNKDADAIGKEVSEDKTKNDESRPIKDRIWDQMKTCFDPEIPCDIVALGLIYKCDITPVGENEHKVAIVMTLTAPGCGMGDVLKKDVEEKVLSVKGVKEAVVEIVFEPQWSMEMMTDEAKVKLGMM